MVSNGLHIRSVLQEGHDVEKVRHYNMVGKDIIWRWKRQPVVKIRLDINWRERSGNLTAFVSNMGGDSNIIYRLSISTIYIYAWRHSWMPVFSFFSLLISYRSLLLYVSIITVCNLLRCVITNVWNKRRYPQTHGYLRIISNGLMRQKN